MNGVKRYVYLREYLKGQVEPCHKRGAAIALQLNEDTGVLDCALALTHRKDSFDRKEAKMWIDKRMLERQGRVTIQRVKKQFDKSGNQLPDLVTEETSGDAGMFFSVNLTGLNYQTSPVMRIIDLVLDEFALRYPVLSDYRTVWNRPVVIVPQAGDMLFTATVFH